LEYMEACIEDVGPASSRARKEAYVRNAPEMVLMLRDLGFKWSWANRYPDYYPTLPGGKTGRVIEAAFFNAKKLGKFRKTQNKMPGMKVPALNSGDAYLLPLALQTWAGFKRVMKVGLREIGYALTGRVALGLGMASTGQLMYILQTKYQTPVWLSSPMKDLIMEDGKAVGLVVEKEGKLVNVQAKKGILLAAGGFPQNPEYRRKYQPIGSDWTSASPGNTGDVHQIGEKIGLGMALMDESWWGGSCILDGIVLFSVWERSFPGGILVDQSGERYVNLANVM